MFIVYYGFINGIIKTPVYKNCAKPYTTFESIFKMLKWYKHKWPYLTSDL